MDEISADVTEMEVTDPCSVCGDQRTYTAPVIRFGDRSIVQRHQTLVCSDACGAEWQRREMERMRAERDQANEWRREALREFIWPRFKNASPDLIDASLRNIGADESVLLTGPTGTGKTFQAWCMWLKWAEQNNQYARRPLFYTAPDLMEALRRSFSGDPVNLPMDQLLVVDDLGTEKSSEWVSEQLYRIIDERYRYCAPTFVTTNLAGRALRDRVGDRLASRLAEMCVSVRLGGKDRRLGGAS